MAPDGMCVSETVEVIKHEAEAQSSNPEETNGLNTHCQGQTVHEAGV